MRTIQPARVLVLGAGVAGLQAIATAKRLGARVSAYDVRAASADDPEGAYALTLVRVAQRFDGFTLLDVTIKTGRTHQIRVHLAGAGHPIARDDKYGDFALNKRLARAGAGQLRLERMFLHARRLRFVHPATGQTLELESPLPQDCATFLQSLQNPGPAASRPQTTADPQVLRS